MKFTIYPGLIGLLAFICYKFWSELQSPSGPDVTVLTDCFIWAAVFAFVGCVPIELTKSKGE